MQLGCGAVVEPFRGSSTSSLLTTFANVSQLHLFIEAFFTLWKSPQIDLKGVPLFLMTQVLRKYPMAIQYIQKTFSSTSGRQSPQHSLTPPSPSLPSTLPQPFTSSTQPYEEDVSLDGFMGRVDKENAPADMYSK